MVYLHISHFFVLLHIVRVVILINHVDYVFLITRDITGRIVKQTNLTKATKEERIKLLAEAGIPLK